MAVKDRMESLFLLEEPNLKERLKKFISVFASEDFLRMLFGNESVDNLIACDGEDGAFVWWDKKPSENPSKELLFSLRVKHTLHKDLIGEGLSVWDMFIGGYSITALDMQLVFAYDTKSDNIQFIGTKDKIFINGKEVKMDFPIYSPSYTNASVPKNNSMNMN